MLDECDRLGIVTWEEIPNIKIHIYPPVEDNVGMVYTERFPRPLVQNLKQQMREMIERDRNHPAIVIWGLSDDLSRYHYPEDFVELSEAAHALDPTRWTAGRAPHVTDIMDATGSYDFETTASTFCTSIGSIRKRGTFGTNGERFSQSGAWRAPLTTIRAEARTASPWATAWPLNSWRAT